MRVSVNGEAKEFSADVTVDVVVADTVDGAAHRGVAVALNGEVIPRSRWAETSLDEGDRLEVLRAIGGG